MKPHLSKVTWARLALTACLLGCILLLLTGPSLGSNWARVQAFIEANPDAKIPWELDANTGIQLAACANIVLLSLLLLTTSWWLRPFTAPPKTAAGRADTGYASPLVGLCNPERATQSLLPDLLSGAPSLPQAINAPPQAPVKSRLPRHLLWGVLVILLLGTAVRLPLASRSLWWDELWTIRQCSHGSWKFDEGNGADKPAAWKFTPASWKRCAFYYQKPTNHVPASLLQKAGLDFWRALSGAADHAFSDLAARVPFLFLSALSLFLVVVLLRAWGAPVSAALLGSALLALHPMAVRYGIEGRGYALVIPLVLGSLLAATRLLRRRGRDGWGWASLACCHLVWLWAFPHGLLDVLVMSLGLAILLALAQANWRDRATVWLRLALAEILAAMLLLQLFLPNVMQARRWAGQENMGHMLDAAILKNTLAQLGTGLRWREPGLGTDLAAGLRDLRTLLGAPEAGAALLIVLALWLCWGIGKSLWNRRRPVWLLAGLLASAAAFAWITWKLDLYYYPRFAVALLPVVALGLALGREQSAAIAGKIQAFLLAVLAAVFAFGLWPLLTRPIEPVRDVANWLIQADAMRGPVLAYGHGREAVMVLLPEAEPVENAAQIQAAIDEARAHDQPLHLVVGHIHFNRTLLPDGFPLLNDPALFTEAARFDGIEADLHYRIYRLNAAAK